MFANPFVGVAFGSVLDFRIDTKGLKFDGSNTRSLHDYRSAVMKFRTKNHHARPMLQPNTETHGRNIKYFDAVMLPKAAPNA